MSALQKVILTVGAAAVLVLTAAALLMAGQAHATGVIVSRDTGVIQTGPRR